MKQEYILKCRNGYGEIIIRKFEARNIIDAKTIAKNFMRHNFLQIGKLVTKSGKQFII